MRKLRIAITILMLCIVAVTLSGCMSMPASMAVSTKPLDQGGYTEVGPATGRAVGVMILGIPLSEPYPQRSAVDRAVAKGGGDALVNVTTDMTQLQIGPVVLIITTVKGTAVTSNK